MIAIVIVVVVVVAVVVVAAAAVVVVVVVVVAGAVGSVVATVCREIKGIWCISTRVVYYYSGRRRRVLKWARFFCFCFFVLVLPILHFGR